MFSQNTVRYTSYIGNVYYGSSSPIIVPSIAHVRFSSIIVGTSHLNGHFAVYEFRCGRSYCVDGSCRYDSSLCDLATKTVSLRESWTHSSRFSPQEKITLASMNARVKFHHSQDFRGADRNQFVIQRNQGQVYPYSQVIVKIDNKVMGKFAKYWGPQVYPLHFGKDAVYLISK